MIFSTLPIDDNYCVATPLLLITISKTGLRYNYINPIDNNLLSSDGICGK